MTHYTLKVVLAGVSKRKRKRRARTMKKQKLKRRRIPKLRMMK
jgi:hypothetical protein